MSLHIAEAFDFRIDLKHLRLAVVLGETRSLSRAAHQLNMSQPTATKLLQHLEEELRVELFKRTNRGVLPTDVGAALIGQARLLLVQLAHTGQSIEDLVRGAGGRIVTGTLLSAASALLPAGIARLRATRPKVMVEVIEGTNDLLVPRLLAGELDFIVGRLSEFRHREEIERETLYSEAIHIVARADHPLAARESIGIDELAMQEWILPPPQTTLRRQLDKAFHDAGISQLQCGVQSVSTLTNRHLIQNTDLLGAWPASLLESDADRGAFASLPVKLPLSAAIGISRRRSAALSPAAELLIEELRSVARTFAA
ncbi:MAG TPA: LysR substrate-binding domain-containing protein [Allosphingosinicella sp.]|nr:LysR substrate-binding domain-containing protein [Allosphingosinicella sp.]